MRKHWIAISQFQTDEIFQKVFHNLLITLENQQIMGPSDLLTYSPPNIGLCYIGEDLTARIELRQVGETRPSASNQLFYFWEGNNGVEKKKIFNWPIVILSLIATPYRSYHGLPLSCLLINLFDRRLTGAPNKRLGSVLTTPLSLFSSLASSLSSAKYHMSCHFHHRVRG